MAITRTIEPSVTVTTRTHFQRTDDLCWLYGLTSSIHRTLLIKLGTFGLRRIVYLAVFNRFLKVTKKTNKKNHWIIRR